MTAIEQAWSVLKGDPNLMEPAATLSAEGNEATMRDAMQRPKDSLSNYGQPAQFANVMGGGDPDPQQFPQFNERGSVDREIVAQQQKHALLTEPGYSQYDRHMNPKTRRKMELQGGFFTDDSKGSEWTAANRQPAQNYMGGRGSNEIDIGDGQTGQFKIAHPSGYRPTSEVGHSQKTIHPEAASMAARAGVGGSTRWVQRMSPEDEYFPSADKDMPESHTISSEDYDEWSGVLNNKGIDERFHGLAQEALRNLHQEGTVYRSAEEKQQAIDNALGRFQTWNTDYDRTQNWKDLAAQKWGGFKEGARDLWDNVSGTTRIHRDDFPPQQEVQEERAFDQPYDWDTKLAGEPMDIAWVVLKEWSDTRGRRAPPTTARIQNKPDSGKFQLQQAIRDARPVHRRRGWGAMRQIEGYDEEDMQRQFEALRALAEQQGGARNE
tara:strand:+ start:6562 stop:7869 length:1308 start_codon:yes stop_codon:yes gene_type:complete